MLIQSYTLYRLDGVSTGWVLFLNFLIRQGILRKLATGQGVRHKQRNVYTLNSRLCRTEARLPHPARLGWGWGMQGHTRAE